MFEMRGYGMNDLTALRRSGLAALAVLSVHVGLILTLQIGMAEPARELVVPVSLLVAPSAQTSVPRPLPVVLATTSPSKVVKPVPPLQPQLTKPAVPAKPEDAARQPPLSSPAPDQAPTAGDHKIATAAAPASNTSATSSSPAAAAPPANALPSAATVTALQLPSTDADYLRNPKPVYPPLSKRLNEQGTVVHSVLIGADGRPISAQLIASSGFDRLDKAAYDAVLQWRYVPGKRQGMPEAMTFNVPIKWVLD